MSVGCRHRGIRPRDLEKLVPIEDDYFDFVFNLDGKANNRGSETWQLVKAADGWRIASIIYSSEPPVQQ